MIAVPAARAIETTRSLDVFCRGASSINDQLTGFYNAALNELCDRPEYAERTGDGMLEEF